MPTATTDDGVTIAYDDVGSGPAIVLVHGITDERGDWAPIVERLAVDHRCVTLDLRGHGESGDAADYGGLAMAGDVAAVVAATGVERPLLVGHSLGAIVVTAAALTVPCSGVVNVDQPLRLGDFQAALAPLAPMLRGTPAEFASALELVFGVLNGDRLDPQTAATLAARAFTARQDVVLGVWSLVLDTPTAELEAMIDLLAPALTVPYLTILGNDPGPGYDEWLRARIADVVIEHWEGDGHFAHLVEPDRFAARLRTLVTALT